MLPKLIFWTTLLFIVYTYAGYPLLLVLWAKIRPKPINKSTPPNLPKASILIAAKNEEKNIGPRIENLLAQNYPKDKIEIIIISDGSNDKTNEIVSEYTKQQKENETPIKLIALDESKGKPNALNQGIKCAQARAKLLFLLMHDRNLTTT